MVVNGGSKGRRTRAKEIKEGNREGRKYITVTEEKSREGTNESEL